MDELVKLGEDKIWNSEIFNLMPHFIFKKPDSNVAEILLSLHKEGLIEFNLNEFPDLLKYVNLYNMLMVFFELVKSIFDFS